MITKAQLKAIHTLLSKERLMGQKQAIISGWTDGRTESSRELSKTEAKELIDYLNQMDEKRDYIRRIWHLAYIMEIIYEGDQDDMKMNAAKLDMFCKERGTVKKNLSLQSLAELKRTAKQFSSMVYKKQKKENIKRDSNALRKAIEEHLKNERYEDANQILSQLKQIENEDKTNGTRANRKRSKEIETEECN